MCKAVQSYIICNTIKSEEWKRQLQMCTHMHMIWVYFQKNNERINQNLKGRGETAERTRMKARMF